MKQPQHIQRTDLVYAFFARLWGGFVGALRLLPDPARVEVLHSIPPRRLMPPAARISDMHVCPKVEPGPVPHVGGPTSSGEPTVLIGFQPAARVGDSLICNGPPDSISQGEPTVIINGKPAARLGDSTSHGGVIVSGCPTVIIGSSAQAPCMASAAASGTPTVTKAQG